MVSPDKSHGTLECYKMQLKTTALVERGTEFLNIEMLGLKYMLKHVPNTLSFRLMSFDFFKKSDSGKNYFILLG